MMRVGIASDHGGFVLKGQVAQSLCTLECEIVDLGAYGLNPADDYPDFIVPLARAIAQRTHALSLRCRRSAARWSVARA
jgi:ribose 5-phosphate isomerase B